MIINIFAFGGGGGGGGVCVCVCVCGLGGGGGGGGGEGWRWGWWVNSDVVWHIQYSLIMMDIIFIVVCCNIYDYYGRNVCARVRAKTRKDMGLLPDTKTFGLRMRRKCRGRFPATAVQRSRHASRHVRHACRDRYLAVSFGVARRENVPGITSGARALFEWGI